MNCEGCAAWNMDECIEWNIASAVPEERFANSPPTL
jgi:hypothetical protein